MKSIVQECITQIEINMDRVINDPTGLTYKDLENYDWDLVKTNITVDPQAFLNWANEALEKNSDAGFSLEYTHLMSEKSRNIVSTYEDQFRGFPRQWTMQWPVERKGPIPNPWLCDPVQFPEIAQEGFTTSISTDLESYNFGYYTKIKSMLNKSETEKDCCLITRLVVFNPTEGFFPHYDVEKGFMVRLHVQAQVDNDCVWNFGEDQSRPHRIMEPGGVYLINTAVKHSTWNLGKQPWIFIHSDPSNEAITRICNTKMHISP